MANYRLGVSILTIILMAAIIVIQHRTIYQQTDKIEFLRDANWALLMSPKKVTCASF